MNILLIHQNFPGQYKHLFEYLRRRPGVKLCVITDAANKREFPVPTLRYPFTPPALEGIPVSARHYATRAARAEQVAQACFLLKKQGFVPDLILGHCGWGETLLLRDVFPRARIQVYSEFFYAAEHADADFDPEFARGPGRLMAAKNAVACSALVDADRGIAPTHWQADRFPPGLREKIDVAFDGIDTRLVSPAAGAEIRLNQAGITLTAQDEVITFVNRNLEPYRGYHSFMRALPRIQRERPKAHVVIVGGDKVSYGRAAPEGKSWKNIFLAEVAPQLDPKRTHFVGRVSYGDLIRLFRISRCHVYLTYPFVLSWSMLEAMSAGALVVGSRTGPVEEVIRDGENGWLVDFFDRDAIAARVVEALADPAGQMPLRRAGRQTILERYDAARICLPRQVSLLKSLLEGAPH